MGCNGQDVRAKQAGGVAEREEGKEKRRVLMDRKEAKSTQKSAILTRYLLRSGCGAVPASHSSVPPARVAPLASFSASALLLLWANQCAPLAGGPSLPPPPLARSSWAGSAAARPILSTASSFDSFFLLVLLFVLIVNSQREDAV